MLEIKSDGFVPVTIGEVQKQLDLYKTHNRLIGLANAAMKRFPGEENQSQANEAFYDGVCEYLTELGFGTVTHGVAEKFDVAVGDAVADLKKSHAPTPE